jgi:hypothetical protein
MNWDDAQEQADRINAYWKQRGVIANAKVVKVDAPAKWRDRTVYGIESDLRVRAA